MNRNTLTIQLKVERLDRFKAIALKAKFARLAAGLEQKDVALSCNVSSSTISYWEKEGTIPGAYLSTIATITGQGIEYFNESQLPATDLDVVRQAIEEIMSNSVKNTK